MNGITTRTSVLRVARSLIAQLEADDLDECQVASLAVTLSSLATPPMADHVHGDGSLRFARWAEAVPSADGELLSIDTDPRPTAMAGAPATGLGLTGNGRMGADIIRVPAGHGFAPHTHPGDHLLVVLAGSGTVTYHGTVYPTSPGLIYMIEGLVPHAVGAITDHVILAIGAPHRPVDSADRQEIVEYEAVRADLGDMTCLICDVTASSPTLLYDVGCSHCPSRWATPPDENRPPVGSQVEAPAL